MIYGIDPSLSCISGAVLTIVIGLIVKYRKAGYMWVLAHLILFSCFVGSIGLDKNIGNSSNSQFN